MNINHLKRFLSAFNSNKTVRLRTLAGDTAWRKIKQTDPEKLEFFPFTHEDIRARQISLFSTAKEMEKLGLVEHVYKRGENFFRKVFQEPRNPEQYLKEVFV